MYSPMADLTALFHWITEALWQWALWVGLAYAVLAVLVFWWSERD